MSNRLTPYGSAEQARNLSKVGKKQTPRSLAARMPSADVAAKVGRPIAQIDDASSGRVVRRNAR